MEHGDRARSLDLNLKAKDERTVRGRTTLTPTEREWHGSALELFLSARSSELYLTSCTLKEDLPLPAALCHRTMYLSAIQAVRSPGVIFLGIRKRVVNKDYDICISLVTPQDTEGAR